MMGWKSEERTVELAGSRGGGEFRKRLPGKTAPAGTPAPGADSGARRDAAPAATPMPGGADRSVCGSRSGGSRCSGHSCRSRRRSICCSGHSAPMPA